MRDILGMGSDPVGTEVDKRHKSPVGIWRIAGNGDRSRAGWTDTVKGDQRREGGPMRRTPTAVSGVWLFLLSSLARRNAFLSLRLRGARREVGTKAKL
jgi:hypothetical protein